MLKGKKGLFILLPLVFIIWGMVIFKIVGAISRESVPTRIIPEPSSQKLTKFERDTFSLVPVYQDPFLGHFYKMPAPKETSTVKPAKDIVWPTIEYLGFVSDTDRPSEVYIFQIDGKQVLMEKGDAVEGVKLIGVSQNSISFFYKGAFKEIIKNSMI